MDSQLDCIMMLVVLLWCIEVVLLDEVVLSRTLLQFLVDLVVLEQVVHLLVLLHRRVETVINEFGLSAFQTKRVWSALVLVKAAAFFLHKRSLLHLV